MTLSTDAKDRKNAPMARGLLDYFPDALAAVANVSRVGNEQHNPGQPMHWAKHLSTDHADCIIRHLADRGTVDTDGLRHAAKVAWRALALLQTEIEAEQEQTRLNDALEAGMEPDAVRLDADTILWTPGRKIKSDEELLLEKTERKYGPAHHRYIHPDVDLSGGFDVCCDQPTNAFSHCEGCHSLVCQQTGACMHLSHDPH